MEVLKARRDVRPRRDSFWVRAFVFGLLVCLALGNAVGDKPDTDKPQTDEEVISNFLLGYVKYGIWPAGRDWRLLKEVRLGVRGNNRLANVLEKVAEGTRQKESSDIKFVIERSDSIDNLKRCHVVLASGLSPNEARSLVTALRGQPVLVVGDTPEFLELGGMLEITIKRGGQSFWGVNKDALGASGIELNALVYLSARDSFQDGRRRSKTKD
jgi:hypothetical protein